MNKVMLVYPTGTLYQRSEERAQCNVTESSTGAMRACNDMGYCAAVLLREGYEVFLRDYQTEQATFADVENDVREFQPDLIALSTTNASVKDDIEFLKRISAFHKCVFVLKGAVFYDIDPALLSDLDLEHISCLVGCEMEFIIGKIAGWYLRGEGSLADIPGVLYKKDGAFVKNAFVCGQNNLEDLPFPARQLMNNALYQRPDTGEPMATIQTSLGCPSRCIYCLTPVISGRNVRKRSVENVYREMEECFYTFGIRNFFFKADDFTIDEAYASAICDRILRSPLRGRIEFTANTRVKPISARLLKKMKQAGCFMIAAGFESGCDETLRRMKKGATVKDNLRAARLIREAGIPLYGFFILGFPWETEEMIQETERLIHRIDPDFIELHTAMPYYGTELYEQCREYGVLDGSGFGHGYYAPNTKGTVSMTYPELEALRRKILLRFYLRPSYVMRKMAGAAGNPEIMKNYVRYGLRLVYKNVPFFGHKAKG